MLQNSTKKQLRERNWLEIIRNDANPSDKRHRLIAQSNNAINDLILIANRLPNDTQDEIFTYRKIEDLIQAILRGNIDGLGHCSLSGDKPILKGDNEDYDNNFNSRVTHIAALLVSQGIKICIEQYKTKIEQDSRLNQATIDKLNIASEICDAIAFKSYSPNIKSVANEGKLTFLFNWNGITTTTVQSPDNIPGENNRKLVQFLKDKLGNALIKLIEERRFEINEIRIKKYEAYNKFDKRQDRIIYCDIIRNPTEMFNCSLRLDYFRNIVELTINDLYGISKNLYKKKIINNKEITTNEIDQELAFNQIKEELIVKQDYGNYYVYAKQ